MGDVYRAAANLKLPRELIQDLIIHLMELGGINDEYEKENQKQTQEGYWKKLVH